ncbi:hypothetical protein HNV12_28215 [Methanococcoides sp. SA1]|nr:hypothetical protein [Methanococcoides sp. SA1]
MPYEMLREYNGTGLFEIKSDTSLNFESKFKLNFFSNALIEVETTIPFTKTSATIMNKTRENLVELSLNGVVFDKSEAVATISIEKMAINNSTLKFEKANPVNIYLKMRCFSDINIIYSDEKLIEVDIHYGLTNFVFFGCETSKVNKQSIRNKFKIEVENYNFLFEKVENYKTLEVKLKEKKGIYVTSEAVVNLPVDKKEELRLIVDSLIELQSLATRNFVSNIYEDWFYDGAIIRTVLKSSLTHYFNSANQLIPEIVSNSCAIKDFLEISFTNF